MDLLPSDSFALRVRDERERQQVSQAEIARRISDILGLSFADTVITRIENQTRAVRLDEAVAIAQALRVPLTWLIEEDPSSQNDRQIQQLLADLAAAENEWEITRQFISKTTRRIHQLMREQSELDKQSTPRVSIDELRKRYEVPASTNVASLYDRQAGQRARRPDGQN